MPRTSLRTFFIFISVVTIASSQTPAPKPLPKEPLEKYDNPPPLAPAVAISPRLISQFGPYTSYQVNVNANGNNTVGDAANEPSICVDPTNRNKMSIGWRQFDSVASNFRQAGFAHTTDGGRTWFSAGVLQNNIFRSDPVLNSDNAGHFFYLSLLQTFFDDLWRSLNGGQSWAYITPAYGGDKEWFTIDNTNSTGHGFQYQSWSSDGNNFAGRQFTRSTNGGLTWMNPIDIPNSPAFGTLDVDSNGNLFIGGAELQGGQVWCVRSTNAKNGAVAPNFDQSTAVSLGGSIVAGELINPQGLVGQIFLAADRSGTSTNNNIYMLASVQPAGFATGSDVMFVRSTNGGQTFGAPRRINDDPVNHAKWHWFGTLSVAPNGRIDAVWLDTRNAANNTDSQLFYSYSLDGGITWSLNVAISNSFNPYLGYPNQDKLGDYITIVSDNAGANVAYAATFNGEEDIYYVRIGRIGWNLITTADFNGNGNPDYVLYNANTRNTAIWYLNNNVYVSGAYGPTLPSGWQLVATGDFNGDGKPDYVLYNTITRQTAIWYLNNNVYLGGAYGPTLPAGWILIGAGDFNGDNKPDYVLYNSGTHQTAIWYLNNNVYIGGGFGPTLPSGWTLVGLADFDRDGHADYLLFHPSSGHTAIWYLSGRALIGAAWGPTIPSGWTLVATADFNGDGKPDYVLYTGDTRQTAIWYLNNNVFVSSAYGPTLRPD
jgi:FG-GAP-like repeat/BNR/Asp-box repeat